RAQANLLLRHRILREHPERAPIIIHLRRPADVLAVAHHAIGVSEKSGERFSGIRPNRAGAFATAEARSKANAEALKRLDIRRRERMQKDAARKLLLVLDIDVAG